MNARQKQSLIDKAKNIAWLVGVFFAAWAFAEGRLEKKIDEQIDKKQVVVIEELLKVSYMLKSVVSDSAQKVAKAQAAEAVKLLKQGKAQ